MTVEAKRMKPRNNQFRVTVPLIITIMVVGAFGVLIGPFSDNVSAATIYTWDAPADGIASLDTNWDPVGVPSTGDSVLFDSTSLFNCSFDIAVALNNFSMETGYGGAYVVQAASFSAHDFLVNSGNWGFNSTYILTLSGGFTHGSGNILTDNGNLIMTGDGETITLGGATQHLYLNNLTINDDTTLTGTPGVIADLSITIASGKVVTVNSRLVANYDCVAAFVNQGQIIGSGRLDFNIKNSDRTLGPTLGTITTDVLMQNTHTTTTRTLTLGADTTFGGDLDIQSYYAGSIMIVSHSANYKLTVVGAVTLGQNGQVTQGTGVWAFGELQQSGTGSAFTQGASFVVGDLNLTAGSFTPDGSNWVICSGDAVFGISTSYWILKLKMTGESKTLGTWYLVAAHSVWFAGSTLHEGGGFNVKYDVTIDSDASFTMSSNTFLAWTLYGTWSNAGAFYTERLLLQFEGATPHTWVPGTISTENLDIWGYSSENQTLTLGGSLDLDGALHLKHTDKDYTMTFNTNGYAMSAGEVIIYETGVFDAGSSTITVDDNWDSTNGLLLSDESTLVIDNNDKDFFIAETHHFNDISITGTDIKLPYSGQMEVDNSSYRVIPDTVDFSGPGNVMVEASNGDYVGFVREGATHVYTGDYAVMSLYRSTDSGLTWHFESIIKNVTNRDVRNYAAGVTPTGRIHILYTIYDVDNSTSDVMVQLMYSDDNGLTWPGTITIPIPTIDGVTPTIGSPYGRVETIASNMVGFSYYCRNATYGHNRFAYSDDDGLTWTHAQIGRTLSVGSPFTETSVVYVGDSKLVAMARRDNSLFSYLFTSIDNGVTWVEEGEIHLPFVPYTIFPPFLEPITDNFGVAWLLSIWTYHRMFYSFALVDEIFDRGIDAWSAVKETEWTLDGMYASLILDANGDGQMMVNYQNTLSDSSLVIIDISVTLDMSGQPTVGEGLIVNTGRSVSLENPACVSNQITIDGAISQNGHRLNITGSSTTPLMGHGTFDGAIYLNGSSVSNNIEIGLPMGYLFTDRDTFILGAYQSYLLRVVPLSDEFVNITIISFGNETDIVIRWESTSIGSVIYGLYNAPSTNGYRVYRDGVIFATGTGPSFTFSAIGDGGFEIVEWYGKGVSSLIVLTVNMVGLGIIVTVLASYIAPIARDIQEKRPIKPEKLTQNLIRTVIFIVVASLMWGVLHSIAIG